MSFDETKPVQNGLLISADHRANFLATRRAGFINMLRDPLFECWPANNSTAPPDWILGGTGAAIVRDTTLSRLGVGDMGARVTRGSANASLRQEVLQSGDYDPFFDARVVTAGVFVHASAAGIARVRINDGVSGASSALNSAANVLEFLPVQYEVNAAATRLDAQCRVDSPGSCTFSGVTFLFSDIMPDRFMLPITVPIDIPFERRGQLFVGLISTWMPSRSFVVREGMAHIITSPPAGAAVSADLNQWDGAVWQSMFTGGNNPTIPIGQHGPDIAVVDGTYNRRCFRKAQQASFPKGSALGGFIDQVGVTPNEGNHLILHARAKGWASPMEIYKAV